ncbi:hypothetical protein B0919_18770 [Hymenobacter sp. CRA2]|nr:hypothetical protein B0919_18770 [Hymenobacter sp. CRA2]
MRSSLWYGLRDIVAEALPGRLRQPHRLRRAEFWSLQDVSFELRRGEALAIIGDNGAGKSTLLKLLNGLIKPDAGTIRILGRVGALIELGVGLDPLLSGRENIFLRASLLGVSQGQVAPLLPAIIDFTGLGSAIEMPVQFYSSGMVSRLAYAVAAHLHPDVLLVDEVLAVGDFDFQRKCIHHMMSYLAGGGSIILVSHQPHHIQSVCQRGLVLEKGQLAFSGTAVEALDYYFGQQLALGSPADAAPAAEALNELKPVVIEEVRMTGAGTGLCPGAAATIQLTYHALRSVQQVSWGFYLYTNDGQVCIGGAFHPTPTRISEGQHVLRCQLARLPLTAGNYLLRAAIFDCNSLQPLALFGWENAPGRLQVEAATSLEKNSHKLLNQLTILDVEWNH